MAYFCLVFSGTTLNHFLLSFTFIQRCVILRMEICVDGVKILPMILIGPQGQGELQHVELDHQPITHTTRVMV